MCKVFKTYEPEPLAAMLGVKGSEQDSGSCNVVSLLTEKSALCFASTR